jgi:hypothetical protein
MERDAAKAEAFDKTFRAIYDKDIPWQDGAENNLLALPAGIQVKVLNHDPAMGRIDMKVKGRKAITSTS